MAAAAPALSGLEGFAHVQEFYKFCIAVLIHFSLSLKVTSLVFKRFSVWYFETELQELNQR